MVLRSWMRFSIVIASRGIVACVLGLAFWAVAPLLVGWTTTTVMSGSMEPAIVPGDLVVSRPIAASDLRPGQVVLAHDPDHHGRLRLHRLVRLDGQEVVTKGDANPQPDSSPLRPSAVLGIGYLRVPWIGLPVFLAKSNQPVPLTALLLGGAAILIVSVSPAVRDPDGDQPSGEAPTGDVGGSIDAPRVARSSDVEPRRARSVWKRMPGPGRGWRRRGALAASLAAIMVIVMPNAAWAAPFASVTRSSASFAAAVAEPPDDLSCRNNDDGTATVSWRYTGQRPLDFDVLVQGRGSIARVGADVRQYVVRPNAPFSYNRTSIIRIRTNLTRDWTATSSSSVSVSTTTFFWIGQARCD